MSKDHKGCRGVAPAAMELREWGGGRVAARPHSVLSRTQDMPSAMNGP